MSFDFMKNMMAPEDEERFIRLCEGIEDVIRETEEGDGGYTDVEIMQALDYIGFNLFRDNWEEFKKMNFNRDVRPKDLQKGKDLIN